MNTDNVTNDILNLFSVDDNIQFTVQSNFGFVHPDERTCLHCVRHDECGWSAANNDGLPTHFGYRSGWNEERFVRHMKGVIGQVCGNFQHGNDAINRRHVQAERRRREERGEGNDWDEEQN